MEVQPCKFELVEMKFVKCTQALATRFRDMKTIAGERKCMPRNIENIEEQIRQRTFAPPRWVCAVFGNDEYRMNGQHTSIVLSKLGNDCKQFKVIYEKYRVNSPEELAELWMIWDGVNSVRKTNQIYLAYASAFPALRELPERVVRTAIGGINRRKTYGSMDGKTTPVGRVKGVENHQDFITWYSGMVDIRWNKHKNTPNLLKYPITGAMMATHEKYPKASTSFWRSVSANNGPDPQGGDRTLRDFLCLNKIGRGGSTERDYYFNCVDCFNHWVQGKDVKSLRSQKKINYWDTIEVIDLPGVEERFANVK